MPTEAAQKTLELLRDPSLFQWYVIPLFALVVYVYANEIERRNWNLVLAGLAFWGMDWFNEIWNSLLFHATGYAPAWNIDMPTAYIIFVGLNIEICFMFAIAGIAFAKTLPADKHLRILGIPNRLFVAVAGSAFCVFVEILLNAAGALVWEWSWWDTGTPWLIFLLGYLPFFLMCFWVYDMESRKKQLGVVSTIYGVNLALILIFGFGMHWL